jgi:NAD(P)-dependent dehydrogenase (short-subunit alcohol dehydrogenase family)
LTSGLDDSDSSLTFDKFVGQVEALARFAEEELGGIDIWVNNAGLSHSSRHDITQGDPTRISRIVECNLLGSIWGCRAAITSMKSNPTGLARPCNAPRGQQTGCSLLL